MELHNKAMRPNSSGRPTWAQVVILIALLGVFYVVNQSGGAPSFFQRSPEPKTAYEFYKAGQRLEKEQKFSKAEVMLKKSLDLDPRFFKAMIELGFVYAQQGESMRAIPLFREALEYSRGDPHGNYENAFFDLGLMYVAERRPEEAWTYLNQAYAVKKNLVGTWKNAHSPTDPVRYVAEQNKEKFVEAVNNYFPRDLGLRHARIKKLVSRRQFHKALRDCEQYLKDNEGSRFFNDILAYKAWVLGYLKEYQASLDIFESLDMTALTDAQKSWVAASIYWNYFRLKEYDKAEAQLDSMLLEYPKDYPASWIESQKAVVYQKQHRYDEERDILQGMANDYLNRGSFIGQFSYFQRFIRERLYEIYSVQRDYLNGFRELQRLYSPGKIAFIVLFQVLTVGLFTLALLVISRLFFLKKTPEIQASAFRLWHLWLFGTVFSLAGPTLQWGLFGLNYYSHDLLGAVGLDPYLVGMILGGMVFTALCVYWLQEKMHWTEPQIGFVVPRFLYLVIVPAIVAACLLLLDQGWEYLFGKLLYFDIPDHPLQGIIEQFLFQGLASQKALLGIAVVVVMPIAEELFFRVFLFRYIEQYTNTILAIILSAFVFSVGHQMFIWIPVYFIFAATLSVMYLRTKSIIPCIVTHGLINLAAFILL